MAETPERGGPNLLDTANTAETIYTAPATGWAILRSVTICSEQTNAEVKVTVGVHTSLADAAGRRLIRNLSLMPGQTEAIDLFVPLNTNDVVYALCDTASGATVTAGVVEGP